MDQLWLVITVMSLLAGVGLLIALIVLRRLSGHHHPPVETVVAGMVAVGVAAFLGVYLRILEVPRSVMPYRVVNSAAWGAAAAAGLRFLLYTPNRTLATAPTATERARRIIPVVVGSGIWGIAFLTVHAPGGDTLDRIIVLVGLQIFVATVAIIAGVSAIRRAPRVKSVPWRIVQHGTGVALLILIPANLAEFLAAIAFRLGGRDVPDGFLFSLGYGIACAVIAVALIRAIRVRVGGDTTLSGSVVPESIARLLGITRREREIIEHLVAGRTDREIAEALYISPRTVETHLRNIYLKCAVTSRMQLSHRLTELREQMEGE